MINGKTYKECYWSLIPSLIAGCHSGSAHLRPEPAAGAWPPPWWPPKSLHAVVLISSVGSFDQLNMEWDEGRSSVSLLKNDAGAFADFALMSHSGWFRDCECRQWSISSSSISASLGAVKRNLSGWALTTVLIGSMEDLLWAHSLHIFL